MARKKKPCWFCESEHMDSTEGRDLQLTAEVSKHTCMKSYVFVQVQMHETGVM